MTALVLINRYARALLHSATKNGLDDREICQALTIDPDAARSQTLVFGPESMMGLITNVRSLLQDDFVGLTSRRCKYGSFDLMCELVLPCSTLSDALSKGVRFYNAVSDDIHFELVERGTVVSLEVSLASPDMDPLHFQSEWWLLLWHRFACWLIGQEIPVSRVDFPHQRSGPPDEYSSVFSHNCHFSQDRARFSFDRKFLQMPLVRDVPDWLEFRDSSRIDLVSIPGTYGTLKSRIKGELRKHLERENAFPTMADLAARYQVSTQTMRRRLEREHVSFRSLVEDSRRDWTLKLVSTTRLPISEISERMGFSEPSALNRAIKRWVGESPLSYRRRCNRDPY